MAIESGSPDPETRTKPPAAGEPRRQRRIGPYRVLDELGRGGMGVVYLAARADDQYQKRVAIKVVGGVDSPEVVRRFRRERQILAGLDHPHIARLFDGGTTGDGLPYFVMEHVQGQPIDVYCDERRLSTRERLGLFRGVCAAVQYAHRSLVVHRDIKPSNILVTTEGVPKLLDFGIARLLNPEVAGEAPTTTRWAMTPEYASPEQVRGDTSITTATDVYSLGVVLYELLTGRRPYRVQASDALELLRAVCEDEPERPSTAVGRTEERKRPDGKTVAATAESVSRTRDGTPERLRRRLRGDLDNILLVALRKEPHRRYGSVEALSEDIRRYLDGLPVTARQGTWAYRASKSLKRNAWAVTAAATVFLLAAGFTLTTAVQSRRVARERDRANREAETARHVSTFLRQLFTVADPSESRGREVTARELLDRGTAIVERGLEGQPDTQAALEATMGSAYRGLGLLDQARLLLERTFATTRRLRGSNHPETAAAMEALASLHTERGDYAAAEPLAREALDIRRQVLGPAHEDVASSLNVLGVLHYYKGELPAAESLLREAVTLRRRASHGGDDLTLTRYQQDLAELLRDKGQLDEAERMMRDNLAVERRHYGDVHPEVVISLNNLATLQLGRQDYAAAEGTYGEAIDASRKLYGEENRHTALYMANLGYVHYEQGRHAEAEPLLRRALEIRRKVLPAGSAELGHSLLLLGRLLVTTGDARGAEPLLREVTELWRRALPAGHQRTADAEGTLGACLVERGQFAEAERLLLGSYAAITAAKKEDSKLGQTTRERLVALYRAWGRPGKAAEWERKAPAAPKG